ncbi:zinc ribbon domain-containing protein [Marinomonas communis]|uniref:zinc ribbon domain-containing protein n=1 Tax=Marinomonas communis TaxID=28254 RepID=UPI001D17FFBD|nr:zinc ribbon domain-containing protein [Marinomonas communis]MCC4275338.1 zinc ribbon domain-containing protein [Marinomonas communis]
MALINCPECQTKVSDTALKCPKCGVQLRKPKRGFFGKLFKWGFIGFNILMLIWLFSYWDSVGDLANTAGSDAAKAGAAIGGTIGTSMLLGLWVFGDIILGLFVMFTRPKS